MGHGNQDWWLSFLCTRRPMAALPLAHPPRVYPVASATCACPGRGNCHQGAWALGAALCVRCPILSGLHAATAVGADFVLRGHIEAACCRFFPQLFIEPLSSAGHTGHTELSPRLCLQGAPRARREGRSHSAASTVAARRRGHWVGTPLLPSTSEACMTPQESGRPAVGS